MKPKKLIITLILLFVSACSTESSTATLTPAITLTPERIVTMTSAPSATATFTPGITATQTATFTLAPLISLIRSPQVFDPFRTYQVGLGDFDGDGDLDAVFTNMGDADSQVWMNDGLGFFTDSGQRLTQLGHGVGVGDLDGDGDLDLFITCATYDLPSKVYLNDGHGVFEDSGQDFGDTELSGNGVDLVDVDGDGDLDAVVKYYLLPHTVYLNDGNAVFTEGELTFPNDTALVWEDLNGDGHTDVFVREERQGYTTMLGDGEGNYSALWHMNDPELVPGWVTAGDIDSDGDIDVLVTKGGNSTTYPTHALLNDGTGRFVDSGQELPHTRWGRIALGDLNGDTYLDAVVSNFGEPNEVWINDGEGNFIDSGVDLGGDTLTSNVVLRDLDNDGDLDIFIAYFGDGSNEIWFNE